MRDIPFFVPRFWVLVARTIWLKWTYRRNDQPYTNHLNEFYTRSRTPNVETYGDAYAGIRALVVEMADSVAGDRILDVATGGGYQAAAFARTGYQVVGADYVHDRALLAQEQHGRGNAQWGVADMTRLPFGDNAFDIVTISLALHDLPAEIHQQGLTELRRVARKRVVIVEPRAPGAWLARHFYAMVGELVDESLHFREFVLRDFDSALKEAGLEVVSRRRCYHGVLAIYVCQP